jgi:cellulose synthase/poly-beta-1,6-N-acetylglucosamine synthase-like glycosyltransferase
MKLFFSWQMVVVAAGLIALLVQMYHIFFRFARVAFHNPPNHPSSKEPVSVIVCARNELKNLQKFLESILNQDYHEFQVVVVNDCSWDESESFLDEMVLKHPTLKVVTIREQEKYLHGKKFAISLGVKAAKYDLLLFTDADCYPVSSDWISRMSATFDPQTEIVLGYGGYLKTKGFLNRLIRFDTLFTAIQFLGAALSKCTYMGVGRNLSYRKSLFFKNKGFAKHNHLLSGDDDLFVNETAVKGNVRVQLHPDAFTMSVPKSTIGEWFRQKRRHQMTSKYYKTAHQWLIGSLFFSHLIFMVAVSVLFAFGFQTYWVLGVLGFWFLIRLIIFGMSMKKLGELDNLWMLPVFDLAMWFIYPFVSLSNWISKPKTWR